MEEDSQGATRYIVRTVAKCTDHNSTVWRVAWNITGTILASSGDDGVVRLWKGIYILFVHNAIHLFHYFKD
jgi:WD40 repeat protein